MRGTALRVLGVIRANPIAPLPERCSSEWSETKLRLPNFRDFALNQPQEQILTKSSGLRVGVVENRRACRQPVDRPGTRITTYVGGRTAAGRGRATEWGTPV